MLLASTKLNYCKTVKQILNKFGEKENKLLYVGEVTAWQCLLYIIASSHNGSYWHYHFYTVNTPNL